jgi:hypothetical protein
LEFRILNFDIEIEIDIDIEIVIDIEIDIEKTVLSIPKTVFFIF